MICGGTYGDAANAMVTASIVCNHARFGLSPAQITTLYFQGHGY